MSVKTKRTALMWYCKTPRGWYRFPAIVDGEGHKREARMGWVIDHGELTHHPDGRFQVRTWQNGKQIYQNLDIKHGRDAVLLWDAITRRVTKAAQIASGDVKRLQTIKSAAAAYVDDLKRENKLEAAENAEQVLAEFEKSCSSIYVKMITRDCVLRYHEALRKAKRSERTIANKHNRVKWFLNWCKVDTSFMPDEPRYEKRANPVIYSPQQIDAIREAADEYKDDYMRLMIDMGLMLGLRDQELMHACWPDVDFHHATFRVTGKPDLGFAVKDAEERLMPIPAELLTRLEQRHAEVPSHRLILGTRNDRPNGHLLRSLKRLAQKAGLNCGQCKTCRTHKPAKREDKPLSANRKSNPDTGQECALWTLHKFRKTYLTTLLRQGVDAKTAQSFAGHSSLETTLKYLAAASSEEMQTKINSIQWGNAVKAQKQTKSKMQTSLKQ
jgi:integrase